MTTKNQLEDFFLFHVIEGNRLLSGNAWGTRPGRTFSFDLESHSFFDYASPACSGKGIKRLFEVRGEKLPEAFRINYRRFKSGVGKRKELAGKEKKRVYLRGPLAEVPPQMTPPNSLSFWDTKGNRSFFPAEVFTYRDFLGRRVGFLLKAQGLQGEKLIRPLSVWERLVGEEKTIFSYRQKAFLPFLYRADLLAGTPEKAVVLLEGEESVEAAVKRSSSLPVTFTTWPFGPKGAFFYPELFDCLEGREVFLLPTHLESQERMQLLKKKYLPRAHLVSFEKLGFEEGGHEDLEEALGDKDLSLLLSNLLAQPDAFAL